MQVKQLKTGFERINVLKPAQAIRHIEEILNYNKYLERNGEKFGCSLDNLRDILNTLESIAENTDNLEEFIDRLYKLQQKMDSSKFNKNRNAVTLSTIHSAKGLEFKEVYLVDLIDDIFPGRSAVKSFQEGKLQDMEEERRIYYVAITRAKEKLTLFGIKRKGPNRVIYSRFLYESIKVLDPSSKRSTVFTEDSHKHRRRESITGISEGTRIFHRKFGEGVIIELNEESILVKFDEQQYGIKKLLLEFSMNSGIITPI